MVGEGFFWIVIAGFFACFFMAFSIGANDVANNFSSSVGSRTLSLPVAIAIAVILETFGATFLGGAVTNTVTNQIIDFNIFYDNQALLMFGMLCAIISAGIWLFLATKFGFPVSTTHSIIGSMLGLGLASGNINCIRWNKIFIVFLSWIIAPIISSTLGATIFCLLRLLILSKPQRSYRLCLRYSWILLFGIALSFSFFLVFKNPLRLPYECWQVLPHQNNSPGYASPCVLSKWAEVHFLTASSVAIAFSFLIGILISIFVYQLADYRVRMFNKRAEISLIHQGNTLGSIELNLSNEESSLPSISSMEMQCDTFENVSLPNNFNEVQSNQHVSHEIQHKAMPDAFSCRVLSTKNNNIVFFGDDVSDTIGVPNGAVTYVNREQLGEDNRVDHAIIVRKNSFNNNENSSVIVKQVTKSRSLMDFDSEKVKNKKPRFGNVCRVWKNCSWFRRMQIKSLEDGVYKCVSHPDIEAFEPNSELFFSCCQIVAACLGCIAHSANDAANAIGPLAAILNIYYKGIGEKYEVDWYLLFFGGISMSLGLSILGYRVIQTVGTRLIKITPCRGFSIDISTAWVVLLFSNFGVPLSTTHCAVGSTLGVGLAERRYQRDGDEYPSFLLNIFNSTSVNWKLFRKIFLSWIATIFFSASVCLVLYLFCVHSPTVITKMHR